MKKAHKLLSLAGLLFFTAAVLSVGRFISKPTNIVQKASISTRLSIDPSTITANRNQDLIFNVKMDTSNNKITGIDIQLNFNPNAVQISSISRGNDVNDLNNTINNNFDNTAGKINYAIFTLNKGVAVQGSDVDVLQIKAKTVANAAAGSYRIEFDASSAISATSESQNALIGTSPTTVTINLNATPLPTPEETETPTPTATATSEPNSCGGTCGSNVNCAANLFCYQGYCKNPSCSWSGDCSCESTPAPTPIPTATSRPLSYNTIKTPVPTEEPAIIEYTPDPEPENTPKEGNFWENIFKDETGVVEPEEGPTPTIEPLNLPETKNIDFLPWIIGSLVIAGITLIFIVIGILKEASRKRSKPPLIKV